MKSAVLGVLGIFVSLSGSLAHAHEEWHAVLSCNDGAVVVDNKAEAYDLSGRPQVVQAQVVIRDEQVIRKFTEAGVGRIAREGYPAPGDYQAAAEIIDHQWIGHQWSSGPADRPLLSFTGFPHVDSVTGAITFYYVTVAYDGKGLSVVAQQDPEHKADWYFRDCTELH